MSADPKTTFALWTHNDGEHSVKNRPEDVEAIHDPEVAAAFDAYDPAIRAELLDLRQEILDTAAATPGVGAIEETLRWGQPSYLTSESGSGSTVRIAPTRRGSDHDYAVYFICHTNLVDSFRARFGDAFTYDGNRGLLFSIADPRPEEQLRAALAMALTYHRTKKPH